MPGPSSITNPSTPNFHPDLYGKNGADSTEAGPSVQHWNGGSVVTNPRARISESPSTTRASGQDEMEITQHPRRELGTTNDASSNISPGDGHFAAEVSKFIDEFRKAIDKGKWNTEGADIAGAPVKPVVSLTKNNAIFDEAQAMLINGLEQANGGTAPLRLETLKKLADCVVHLPTSEHAHEDKQLIAIRLGRRLTHSVGWRDGQLGDLAQTVSKLATNSQLASNPHKLSVRKEFRRTLGAIDKIGVGLGPFGMAAAAPFALTFGFAGSILYAAAKDNKNTNKALEWLHEIVTCMELSVVHDPEFLNDKTLAAFAKAVAHGGGEKCRKLEKRIDQFAEANNRSPAWSRIRQQAFIERGAALRGNPS